MIQADHVHYFKCRSKAFGPPFVSGSLNMIPAVNRVTPKLSSGAEIIGRNSGHLRGFAIGIEFEEIGIRPYVGAVMRHVNWNIAHHLNSVRLTVTLQLG